MDPEILCLGLAFSYVLSSGSGDCQRNDTATTVYQWVQPAAVGMPSMVVINDPVSNHHY
jgi:hypothetical protein